MAHSDIPSTAPIAQIHDYPSLFHQVRMRPGMWFGEKSLSRFEAFLAGISCSEYFYRVADDRCLAGFDFEAFQNWANPQFNPDRLSINTFGMAQRHSDSDELAFDTWFSWVDRFLSETET